ncbi:putative sugar ABC transporter permease [Candidatus Moduliflexus flocculans]|uniref:Putative sugar ABC transporter permease n=1 Tax=Candidatus Moduliflexus flocculans TaxID=1499966 RepID=A0A0S6VTT9_9BACT|nr:putative sugar ABC transporter permease [Candidatus Moduliflexus flocculans]
MRHPSKSPRFFIVYFLLPALSLYTIFFTLPILDSIRLSFYDSNGLIVGEFVGVANFVKLFTQYPFQERLINAFSNNVKFFLIVTVIQNFIGFLFAYLLTQRIWGMPAIRKISFLPTTLSVLVVGYLFAKLIFNPVFGVFDKLLKFFYLGAFVRPWLGDPMFALPTLAAVVSWQFMGETILFYTAGIDNIPDEIIEAARLDGANHLQMIRHVIVPSILPVIGIVTILIFIGDFTQFDIVYAMATTVGNPAYATDLFGSLFYRAAFMPPARGGWGIGMGAAVSTVMSIIVFAGVLAWLIFFRNMQKTES